MISDYASFFGVVWIPERIPEAGGDKAPLAGAVKV
jgi:hypothetical protein